MVHSRDIKSSNVVQQVARIFANQEKFVIGILPEGTRRKQDHWKTGFYHIALTANVPIVLTSLDYKYKLARFGPIVTPCGDIQADIEKMRPFYADVNGKHPELMSDIRIRP